MKIAIIASDAFELKGIVSVLENSEKTRLPFRFSRVGKWKCNKVICVADGPGFSIAGKVARSVVEEFEPDSVWSVGLCGALDDSLRVGDVVTAKTVVDPAANESFETESQNIKGGKRVTIVSQDRIAASVQEKKALRHWGEVVEMEAAAIARELRSKEIKFSCVKVVSDAAGEEFGIDLNNARDPQGRIQTSRILREAFRNPVKNFSELARLFKQSRYASGCLGEFIVNSGI